MISGAKNGSNYPLRMPESNEVASYAKRHSKVWVFLNNDSGGDVETKRSGKCRSCFGYLTVTITDDDKLEEYLDQFGGDLSGCYNVLKRRFAKDGTIKVFRCIHNSERAYLVMPTNRIEDCPSFNLDANKKLLWK